MPREGALPDAASAPAEPDDEDASRLLSEQSSHDTVVVERGQAAPAAKDPADSVGHPSHERGPVEADHDRQGQEGSASPDLRIARTQEIAEPSSQQLWSLPPGHGGWRVEGTSVIGQLHVREGRARDDAAVVIREGPWTFVAVADGAGSKKLSRFGAGEAVRVACETLHEHLRALDPVQLTDDVLATCLQSAFSSAFNTSRSSVVGVAARLESSPADLACTLVLLAHHATESTDTVAAAQVGDGAVVGIYHTGTSHAGAQAVVDFVVPPEGGEYGAQTFFLTGADGPARALRSLRVWRLTPNADGGSRRLDGLLVMTDGVLDCVYPPAAILGKAARNWISVALAPSAGPTVAYDLARWLSAWEVPGSQDDRTLMMLVRSASTSDGR